MSDLGEKSQTATIQVDDEEFHWLEVNYCYPDGLPVEGTYLAIDGDGLQHSGTLNDLGGVCLNYLPAGPVKVEFIPPEDSDTLKDLRTTIKDVLDEMLAEKQAETKQTNARLAKMNPVQQQYEHDKAKLKGLWNGAVGLFEFVVDAVTTAIEIAQYLSPVERLNNLLEASYKSYRSGSFSEEKWLQSLLDNMKQKELKDLAKLLGFDPREIDLALITEAYEITAFIATDEETLEILKNFAKAYVDAQSSLDWAEFAGGGVFEIVLAALLIAFTGGAGLVAQAGSKLRHVSRLRKLGELFRRLGKQLKLKHLNKKIEVNVDSKKLVEAELPEGVKLQKQGDVDEGRMHGDPPGTKRNKNGQLYNEKTGQFVDDPNTPKDKYRRNKAERKKALERDANDPNSNLTPEAKEYIKKHKGNKVPDKTYNQDYKGDVDYAVHHNEPLHTRGTIEDKKAIDKASNMEVIPKNDHVDTHRPCGDSFHDFPRRN